MDRKLHATVRRQRHAELFPDSVLRSCAGFAICNERHTKILNKKIGQGFI